MCSLYMIPITLKTILLDATEYRPAYNHCVTLQYRHKFDKGTICATLLCTISCNMGRHMFQQNIIFGSTVNFDSI